MKKYGCVAGWLVAWAGLWLWLWLWESPASSEFIAGGSLVFGAFNFVLAPRVLLGLRVRPVSFLIVGLFSSLIPYGLGAIGLEILCSTTQPNISSHMMTTALCYSGHARLGGAALSVGLTLAGAILAGLIIRLEKSSDQQRVQ